MPSHSAFASAIPLLISLTTGDFPDGNRGCHASHRASCAVSARPFGQRVSIPGCRNVNPTLAATVPVTPPLARRFLRFSHPGGKAAGL
ncbi:hypothetical protein GW742_23480 [Citrobacter freundii]|nr:hypothetical protein [Citrobacter freundii]MBC6509432.1 hypothetical protein [Citrobacter freundii]